MLLKSLLQSLTAGHLWGGPNAEWPPGHYRANLLYSSWCCLFALCDDRCWWSLNFQAWDKSTDLDCVMCLWTVGCWDILTPVHEWKNLVSIVYYCISSNYTITQRVIIKHFLKKEYVKFGLSSSNQNNFKWLSRNIIDYS